MVCFGLASSWQVQPSAEQHQVHVWIAGAQALIPNLRHLCCSLLCSSLQVTDKDEDVFFDDVAGIGDAKVGCWRYQAVGARLWVPGCW